MRTLAEAFDEAWQEIEPRFATDDDEREYASYRLAAIIMLLGHETRDPAALKALALQILTRKALADEEMKDQRKRAPKGVKAA